jgi:hypothetical protein
LDFFKYIYLDGVPVLKAEHTLSVFIHLSGWCSSVECSCSLMQNVPGLFLKDIYLDGVPVLKTVVH